MVTLKFFKDKIGSKYTCTPKRTKLYRLNKTGSRST